VYNKILYKSEFGQTHCVELSMWMPTKFSLQFLNIASNFYEFWKFKLFSGKFTKSKRKEKMKPGTGPWFQPKTTVPGRGVGWWPAVAAGCHGVAAHRAA
jgi:hypothetical protein